MAVIRFGGGGSGGLNLSVTANRALVSNAAGTGINATSVTTTEIGFVSGATSNIQAQINTKRSTASGKVLTDFQSCTATGSFTSSGTGYNDIGLLCTFTVAATSDVVSVNFMGTGGFSGTQNGMVAYQIDAATQVDVLQLGGSADRLNQSFTADLTGLSAGSHTAKIYLKTGSGTMTTFFHDVGTEAAVLSVKVFG